MMTDPNKATTYLNWNGPDGRETLDELSRADYSTLREYAREQERLSREYADAGMSETYWSRRPCANWN